MKLNLRRKIFILTAAAATLPVLIVLILVISLEDRMVSGIRDISISSAQAELTEICNILYNRFEAFNNYLESEAAQDLEIADHILAQRGGLEPAPGAQTWKGINQYTNEALTVSLPSVRLGGRILSPNASKERPVVEEIASLTSGAASVFQRMNEQGDMLAVATTLTDEHANLAGHFIPAHLSAGNPNPVIATVLNGGTYVGHSLFDGTHYIGAFQGLHDRSGRLIGMLNTAKDVKSQKYLQEGVERLSIGNNREIVIIGCHGAQKGQILISTRGELDGKSVLNNTDPSGKTYVADEIKRALANPPGKILYDNYTDSAGVRRLAVFMYYEPWDWLIRVSLGENEYLSASVSAVSIFRQLSWGVLIVGLLMLILAIGVGYWIGRRLTTGLELLSRVAGMMAQGNLGGAEAALAAHEETESDGRLRRMDSADESEALFHSFRQMIVTLSALIAQVQQSGIQVTTSTTEIAASARHLEAAATEQAASAREVSATTARISSTSGELLKSVNAVGDTLASATSQAELGHAELNRMEAAMRQLSSATASISSRLGNISDRTSRISTVVTTINKVADRTALLSVNAAIEAEKAGEFGKGFSVVAREISRLADQTAVATQDIEQVVKEMQSSVASGVMEMDKFSEEVRRHVHDVHKVAAEINGIIDGVQALGPNFEASQQGMHVQAESAQQIAEAIQQLSIAAEQSKESLSQFKHATEQLNSAVISLQGQVSQFTLKS